MNIALILSSGVGQRFGGNIPKQYLEVCGKKVVDYVIDAACKAKLVDKVVIVAHEPYLFQMQKQYLNIAFVEGGDTRNKSLRNGVDFIKNNYDCDSVIVLDAVRPFVREKIIDDYIKYVNDEHYDICVTTKKITDSLCCLDTKECDRDRYFMTASPMAFEFNKLDKYLDKDSRLVEVLQMYPDDTKIFYYYDFRDNYKVTYVEDLELIECLMRFRKT